MKTPVVMRPRSRLIRSSTTLCPSFVEKSFGARPRTFGLVVDWPIHPLPARPVDLVAADLEMPTTPTLWHSPESDVEPHGIGLDIQMHLVVALLRLVVMIGPAGATGSMVKISQVLSYSSLWDQPSVPARCR